jgi:hypothetical protein
MQVTINYLTMKWTTVCKNTALVVQIISQKGGLPSGTGAGKEYSGSTTLVPGRSCWSHQTLSNPRMLFRSATMCCHHPRHRHPAGDDEMGSSETLLCRPEMEFLNGILW